MFDVKKEAAALSAELETIYKDLHRHPEIGYDEHRTSPSPAWWEHWIPAAPAKRC